MLTLTSEYLRSQGLSPKIVQRFWDRIFIVPYDNGCWLWTAGTSSGYGAISIWPNGMIRTHVLSWIIHFGPVPEGNYVCHTCDIRICARPHHLWLGNHEENQLDKVSKGRQNRIVTWTNGEQNGMAKLSAEQVLEIRRRYRPSLRNAKRIAEEFSIDRSQVLNIFHRKQWAHV